MRSAYVLFALLLTVSCAKVQRTEPVSPEPVDTAVAIPAHVEDAIRVLLGGGGRHASPMPNNVRKAYETLRAYDMPEEGMGKRKVGGSYYKTYYFPKSRIRLLFHRSAEGVTSNTLTQE